MFENLKDKFSLTSVLIGLAIIVLIEIFIHFDLGIFFRNKKDHNRFFKSKNKNPEPISKSGIKKDGELSPFFERSKEEKEDLNNRFTSGGDGGFD